MDLILRGAPNARRVALLPAAWNPPTRAHLALAEAALQFADEVLLALPRVFPHKGFDHASFDTRLEWLQRIARARSHLGVAVTERGLFLEIARAFRAADPEVERVFIVCGCDAAERFFAWPYGAGPDVAEQLREFHLLVAPRDRPFTPPAQLSSSVHALALQPGLTAISSTDVRRRIAVDEAWGHLVPEEIRADAAGIYS